MKSKLALLASAAALMMVGCASQPPQMASADGIRRGNRIASVPVRDG